MSDDQATEQSLEDRIIGQFDPEALTDESEAAEEATPEAEVETQGEEPEGEEPSQEETSDGYEEVEYEGQTYQVPQELKEALLRQSDYTRKTQEVADQRRQVEMREAELRQAQSEREFQQSIAQEYSQLQQLDYQIKQFEGMNWSEMSSDEMIRNKVQMDQLERNKRELQQALQGKYQEFQTQQQQSRKELLQKGQEALKKAIPNWSKDTAKEVTQYALDSGYTQEQVSAITSPQDVAMLWKAMQFDKLQSQKGDAVAKASKAPPVVKPGSSKAMPKDVQQKLNYRKAIKKASNSHDKARLIQERLAQQFGG